MPRVFGWLILYDAYTLHPIGEFTTEHMSPEAKEIISELDSNPRMFQRFKIQTYIRTYAAFIGYLGAFFSDTLGKLVCVSFIYWCKCDDFNTLMNFCKDIMKRFGGDEAGEIRLYNDINKAIDA